MRKCIRCVAQLLSWSVRAAVEPGQLPAAEICSGGERRGHFPEVRTAATERPAKGGCRPQPQPARPLQPRCRHSGRAKAPHETPRGRGGLPPCFLRPLLATPWLTVPPTCGLLPARGWEASVGSRTLPWARGPSRPRQQPWAGGCDSAAGWLPVAGGATHREFCFPREKIKEGARRKRRRVENTPAACWGEWNQPISCVSFWLEWGPSSPAPGHSFLHPEPATRNLTPV